LKLPLIEKAISLPATADGLQERRSRRAELSLILDLFTSPAWTAELCDAGLDGGRLDLFVQGGVDFMGVLSRRDHQGTKLPAK